jgi:hypothetical protein
MQNVEKQLLRWLYYGDTLFKPEQQGHKSFDDFVYKEKKLKVLRYKNQIKLATL